MTADTMPRDGRAAALAGLDAAIGRVRALLARHGGDEPAVPVPTSAPCPALDRIAGTFGLSDFERDVLVLAAAAELNGEVAELCARLHGDPGKPYPTFGLAMRVLPGAHWDAMLAERPLRRWRLVGVEGEDAPHRTGLTLARLGVPEAVLHALLGLPALDRRLAALVAAVDVAEVPGGQVVDPAGQLAEILARGAETGLLPAVVLDGPVAAVEQAAAVAGARLGLSLYRLEEASLPRDAEALDALCRLWERDAALVGAALLIVSEAAGGDDRGSALARLVDRMNTVVLATGSGTAALGTGRRPLLRLEVAGPDVEDRQVQWRTALGPVAAQVPAETLLRLADAFTLGPAAVRACAGAALAEGASAGEALGARLWALARIQGRARLDGLAQRVTGSFRMDDLILPDETRRMLEQITVHQRQRHRVARDWGFGDRGAAGLAVMFAGPSGTGKTMAAGVIARELDLDLYRIDLSAVVDKYIGETEKNLRRVFDAAEASGAVLLFDEADALFGRRSEVRDSHDRHANIEVAYLLQRMETYRGLAILTTNLASSLDDAFLRRINYILHFPFPDAAQRSAIWRKAYPEDVALDDLTWERLGQLNLSGGQIRTVALNAAMLVGEGRRTIGVNELWPAVAAEYAKQQRRPLAAELEGWSS